MTVVEGIGRAVSPRLAVSFEFRPCNLNVVFTCREFYLFGDI